jgi:hypothetical protein
VLESDKRDESRWLETGDLAAILAEVLWPKKEGFRVEMFLADCLVLTDRIGALATSGPKK